MMTGYFSDSLSRMGYKQCHQLFSDSAKPKFPSQNQAIEVPTTKPESGIMCNPLPWENSPVPLKHMNWLVGSGTSPANLTERNVSIPVVKTNGSNAKEIVTDVKAENNSSISSSIHDGIGKVEANQAKDCENGLHTSVTKTHSYNKGYFNFTSFSSYQDVMDALERPVSSYSLLYEHPSAQKSFTHRKKKVGGRNGNAIVKTPKSKLESKKAIKAPNKFPTNVRSLTVTGMLDGVPVRYVSTSGEKIRGIINGSGYLCGCDSCNYTKALNAYEFERHAGCKTSHPNNHIRFENGKTIYQIVQELKSTPDDMLFDAVQTVTGSPINQTAFLVWKESYQAATRKLQGISAKNSNICDSNTQVQKLIQF
ncbi:hypothetical protein DH2020_007426 [Rehmannia glutinosa]|uniref:Tify domain-containing protein n=1 Tax=Rehmannia glutinosa TaxID=99300 RepID=A0ABR0TYD4_REHGL